MKIFWIGRTEFFNLAEELKSFIVLYILSFYIIVLSAEKKLYSYLFWRILIHLQ